MEAGEALDFPPVCMVWEILVHFAPRLITAKQCNAQPVIPGRGIVAGIHVGVNFVRCYAYRAMERRSRPFRWR